MKYGFHDGAVVSADSERGGREGGGVGKEGGGVRSRNVNTLLLLRSLTVRLQEPCEPDTTDWIILPIVTAWTLYASYLDFFG